MKFTDRNILENAAFVLAEHDMGHLADELFAELERTGYYDGCTQDQAE